MDKYILNSDGQAYSTRNEAQDDANILSQSVGNRFLVLPYQDGFALVEVPTDGKPPAQPATPMAAQESKVLSLEEQFDASQNPQSRGMTAEIVDASHPGMGNAYATSLDSMPGPESDPTFAQLHGSLEEEPIAEPAAPEPAIINQPVIEQTQEAATRPSPMGIPDVVYEQQQAHTPEPIPATTDEKIEEQPDSQEENGKDLTLSPCIPYFYREIGASVLLIFIAAWVTFSNDLGDPTLNEWASQPGFYATMNKTVLCIIAGLFVRCAFIYANFTFSFQDDIIKTRKGIVSRNASSIRVKDVRKIGLDQNVIERLLDFGTLQFYSSGSSGEDVVFTGIANPVGVRKHFEQFTI